MRLVSFRAFYTAQSLITYTRRAQMVILRHVREAYSMQHEASQISA